MKTEVNFEQYGPGRVSATICGIEIVAYEEEVTPEFCDKAVKYCKKAKEMEPCMVEYIKDNGILPDDIKDESVAEIERELSYPQLEIFPDNGGMFSWLGVEFSYRNIISIEFNGLFEELVSCQMI